MMKYCLRKWLFLSMIGIGITIGGILTGCMVKTQPDPRVESDYLPDMDQPYFAPDSPPDIAQPLPPMMGSLFNNTRIL